MLAIDISIYTGEVTDVQMQAVKDAGYELVIVGLWHGQSKNRYAAQQMSVAYATRMEVDYYALIAPPSWTPYRPAEQVVQGIRAAPQYTFPTRNFIAVDAEVDITPDMLLEALTEAKKHGRTCIYTGAWWWNFFILRYHDWFYQHPDAFANEPSWLADYDWQPVLDTKQLGHLGPVVGKQFKGSTSEVGGINADLNVFDPAFVLGDEEEEEVPGLTVEEIKALIDEETNYPLLVQPEGRKETYELIGDTLSHIENPETFEGKDFIWKKVKVLPVTHEIWKRRVLYPNGVPITLLLPGLS